MWKKSWADLRRDMEAHAHPDRVVHSLQLLAEETPEFAEFCPHCKVTAGPCRSASGRLAETHSMRLHRAKQAVS